tara:strand:- start:1275 stop:1805 length:531 start_codon:yes stop_codon:yes gene_type:complete
MQERNNSIKSLVNKLKFKDVEDDEVFKKTKKSVKDSILFNPIIIEEPEFKDFEYEEIPLKIEQQYFGEQSKDHYYHEINYKIAGDKELLFYTPENFSYSTSDHGILEPNGNSIKVIVDLPEINPEKAKIEANKLFKLTKKIAEQNSETAISWNLGMSRKIEKDLENKREELNRIFG